MFTSHHLEWEQEEKNCGRQVGQHRLLEARSEVWVGRVPGEGEVPEFARTEAAPARLAVIARQHHGQPTGLEPNADYLWSNQKLSTALAQARGLCGCFVG